MDTNNRILLNMAINNVERRMVVGGLEVSKFKEKVSKRFELYRQIHEEEGK